MIALEPNMSKTLLKTIQSLPVAAAKALTAYRPPPRAGATFLTAGITDSLGQS